MNPIRLNPAAPAIDASMTRRRGNGMLNPDLCPIALDESPIRVEAETGRVADMQTPVAQLGMLMEQPIGERVGFGSAMRLDAVGAARQGEYEMAVDFRRGMRRGHDAVLLGERGD